jgi:A/G-specific adenine glycosylase
MEIEYMKKTRKNTINNFRKRVYRHFNKHGRDFPWRQTNNPYHILVSEIMLQQTQVDRVIDKYALFIKTFPTLHSLAIAPLDKLLRTWQGLGYNRRALMLQKCARHIVKDYNGTVPDGPELLEKLPGLGKATSASICAFAFNKPVIFIETNIRSVIIHEFFPNRKNVTDNELLPLVAQTLDKKNPCTWYSALMDYGTHLKKHHQNPSRKSARHTRQSKFEGSDRQIRGTVLKVVLNHGSLSFSKLSKAVNIEGSRLKKIVKGLVAEGFIGCINNRYFINVE